MEEAVAHHEVSYQLNKKQADLDIDFFINTKRDYATALSRVNRHDEAIALFHEVWAHWSTLDPPNEFSSAFAALNFALIYVAKGDRVEAEKWLLKTRQMNNALWGPTHFRHALVNTPLAKLYMQQGKMEEAMRTVESSITLLENNFGPDYSLVLNAKALKAEILLNNGESTAAATLLENMVENEQHKAVGGHIRNLKPLLLLSRAYVESSQPIKADSLLHKSYDYYKDASGNDAVFTLSLEAALEELHMSNKELDHRLN